MSFSKLSLTRMVERKPNLFKMIRKKVENEEFTSTCVDMEEVIQLVKMEKSTENLDVLCKKVRYDYE